MEHKNTSHLPFQTALETYQALRQCINTGDLPRCIDGIIDTLGFYKEYFIEYQDRGTSQERCAAKECLASISTMIATLAWRESRSNAVFYSDL